MHKPTLLIVEDDILIAMDAAGQAEQAGYAVLVAHSVADARRIMLMEEIDGAILDFELPDGVITPVAHALREAGLPYSIVSATSCEAIEKTGLTQPPLVAKPADYLRVIANLMRDKPAATGPARLAG